MLNNILKNFFSHTLVKVILLRPLIIMNLVNQLIYDHVLCIAEISADYLISPLFWL